MDVAQFDEGNGVHAMPFVTTELIGISIPVNMNESLPENHVKQPLLVSQPVSKLCVVSPKKLRCGTRPLTVSDRVPGRFVPDESAFRPSVRRPAGTHRTEIGQA